MMIFADKAIDIISDSPDVDRHIRHVEPTASMCYLAPYLADDLMNYLMATTAYEILERARAISRDFWAADSFLRHPALHASTFC